LVFNGRCPWRDFLNKRNSLLYKSAPREEQVQGLRGACICAHSRVKSGCNDCKRRKASLPPPARSCDPMLGMNTSHTRRARAQVSCGRHSHTPEMPTNVMRTFIGMSESDSPSLERLSSSSSYHLHLLLGGSRLLRVDLTVAGIEWQRGTESLVSRMLPEKKK
jgi:hypothetical protein